MLAVLSYVLDAVIGLRNAHDPDHGNPRGRCPLPPPEDPPPTASARLRCSSISIGATPMLSAQHRQRPERGASASEPVSPETCVPGACRDPGVATGRAGTRDPGVPRILRALTDPGSQRCDLTNPPAERSDAGKRRRAARPRSFPGSASCLARAVPSRCRPLSSRRTTRRPKAN